MIAAFYRIVLGVERRLASTLLVLMVVLIFVGGIARLVGHPLNWTTDAATCAFAWACFLCADVAWQRNGLVAIDVLTSRLPSIAQRVIAQANLVVIAAFLIYAIGWGTWLSWISRERSFQGIPEVSYSWVTMSMVVGSLLLLVTTLLKLRDARRSAHPRLGGAASGVAAST